MSLASTTTIMNLLLHFLPILAIAQDSCGNCVGRGYVYCRAEDFFEDTQSQCTCSFDGFFRSCDDYAFGSTSLSSTWDCKFNNSNGQAILGVVFALPILITCCFCACCCAYLFYRNKTTTSGPSYQGPPSPPTPVPTKLSNKPHTMQILHTPPPAINPAYATAPPDYDILVEPSIADQILASLKQQDL